MKPFVALALALLLTGCLANPNLRSEAEELRASLAGLPGVQQVTLDYTDPVTLDTGKLDLTVTMSADAEPGEVTEVVTTTYDAFAGAHHDEEGDLEVTLG